MSVDKEVILMPEFGSWMVEAVPSKPYNSLIEAADIFSCKEKLHDRHDTLDKFSSGYNFAIASLANIMRVGT